MRNDETEELAVCPDKVQGVRNIDIQNYLLKRPGEQPLCSGVRVLTVCRWGRHILKTLSPKHKNKLQAYYVSRAHRRQL